MTFQQCISLKLINVFFPSDISNKHKEFSWKPCDIGQLDEFWGCILCFQLCTWVELSRWCKLHLDHIYSLHYFFLINLMMVLGKSFQGHSSYLQSYVVWELYLFISWFQRRRGVHLKKSKHLLLISINKKFFLIYGIHHQCI